MNYINLLTLEFPRYEGDIRLDHPEIGEVFVCPETYAPVTVSEEPSFDVYTQKIVFGAPYLNNNEWFVDLLVVELTDEEKASKKLKPSEIETNPIMKKLREEFEKAQA